MEKENLGITNFYNKVSRTSKCYIKKNVEDFVVYEITNEGVLSYKPLIDLEKYLISKNLYKELVLTGISSKKNERVELYRKLRYYPFKQLVTTNGNFDIVEREEDVYVFTLLKYNLNIDEIVHILTKRLEVAAKNIQFSGTKDKYGISFQEISVKCNFKKLFSYSIALNQSNDYKFFELGYCREIEKINEKIIGEIENELSSRKENGSVIEIEKAQDRLLIMNIRKGTPKNLGDNVGNYFRIRLYGIDSIDFIPRYVFNYYGEQRFGKRKNNHLIGELILEKKHTEALDLIVSESTDSKEYVRSDSYVITLIKRLRKKGYKDDDIVKRLGRITQMTYMHSYQSFIFNMRLNEIVESEKRGPNQYILKDGDYVTAPEDNTDMKDIYIELPSEKNKYLKGGYRSILTEISNFKWEKVESDIAAIDVCFQLQKSAYATIVLRELAGKSIPSYNVVNE